MHWTDIPTPVLDLLRAGTVIPAHPLALGEGSAMDTVRQRTLTRYYVDAGVGGLAVGVHTTQFEIREHGLYDTVLAACAEAASDWTDRPLVQIAGLVGRTEQACKEARIARALGYHAGLLSLAALKGSSIDELIAHCAAVAGEIPLFGFYLQPPYAMHAWYLRELYLNNKLIEKDALTLAGEPIDLGAISQPVYAVSAEDDHIAPWRQTFRTMNYVAGPKRFVLSSSGHILGIVNPPVKPPKRKFWVGQARRSDSADSWHGGAKVLPGSWWADWMAWLKPQCGELVDAEPVATDAYPALADAPGTYVLES